jgi:cell division septation protein DedD
MPDLNLVDEGGLEESSAPGPSAAPARRARGGGGGGSKTVLILFFLLLIAAVAVFILNKRGIIKLWGKKATPTMATEVQEPDMTTEQVPGETTEPVPSGGAQPPAMTPSADTGEVALLETPPVDEYTPVQGGEEARPGTPGGGMKPATTKPEVRLPKPEASMTASPNLTDMRGEFTVQVVAFREKAKADQIKENLTDAGYPAFIERVPMKDGDWYTVRIGRYPSRNEAKKAVETFADQIRSSYVIDKVRSK